jgi:hypothetical protein
MYPQKPRNVSVRFTETFLRDFLKGSTDEEQVKLLARVIAENPTCGKVSQEIEHLRCLAWTTNGTADLCVWYLYYPASAHIEVVAVTRPDDDLADARNVRRAVWWVMRIGFALRLGYRAYRFAEEHVWPLLNHLM